MCGCVSLASPTRRTMVAWKDGDTFLPVHVPRALTHTYGTGCTNKTSNKLTKPLVRAIGTLNDFGV